MGLTEDFQKLTPSKCFAIGFLLAVVYYLLLFDKGESAEQQIKAVQAEITEMNDRLQKVNDALANKTSVEGKASAITKELEELLKFFPANSNINDFQKDITVLLKKTNNQLTKILEEDTKARFPDYPEVGVKLEIEGGYHEIMDFLAQLTRMPRMIDYKTMEFQNNLSTDEYSRVKLSLLLTVFSYDPVAPSKEGAQQ